MKTKLSYVLLVFLGISFLQGTATAQDTFAEQRQELLGILSTIESAMNEADMATVEPYIRPNTVKY